MNRIAAKVLSVALISVFCFGVYRVYEIATDKLSFEDRVSIETLEIVNRIAANGMVQGCAVGFAGRRPKQYDNFIELQDQATTEELLSLIDHWSPAVRCYSFWALSNDSTVELLPLVVAHLNDDELVRTQFGCIIQDEKVGDEFANTARGSFLRSEVGHRGKTLLEELDSTLIFVDNSLVARNSALDRAVTREGWYSRFRELVVSEQNPHALVVVAMYRELQDTALILNFRTGYGDDERGFRYTYRAIREFNHPSFWPLLKTNLMKTLDNTHFSSEWQELYRAIACYQSDAAATLLVVPFTDVVHKDIRKYHIDFVLNAVSEFKGPVYHDLLWKLWSEEKRLTTGIFQYLLRLYPKRALEMAKRDLNNSSEFVNANIGDFGTNSPESLVAMLLDTVATRDSLFSCEIIEKGLTDEGTCLFPVYSERAARIRRSTFIEPLFDRLENDTSPYIYLEAAEALIAYGDDKLNQRILNARHVNKALTEDWGGDRFRKLLKDNDLL